MYRRPSPLRLYRPSLDRTDFIPFDPSSNGSNGTDSHVSTPGFSYFLGVPDSPFVRAVGAKWMISAVARIFKPGCKADCALILEGLQGLGKSTAARVIADPWFSDEIAEFGSKDAAMQLSGVWVIELAELDSMNRAGVDVVKSFISRSNDRFRPPYGRRVTEVRRQCVFVGTVNGNDYLKDETGGRRFWPVQCESIDIDALRRNRTQLWAEARSTVSGWRNLVDRRSNRPSPGRN